MSEGVSEMGDELYVKLYEDCEVCGGAGVLKEIDIYDYQCNACQGTGKAAVYITPEEFGERIAAGMMRRING